jgi:hypothetical protein
MPHFVRPFGHFIPAEHSVYTAGIMALFSLGMIFMHARGFGKRR